jgi:hypothetical protein
MRRPEQKHWLPTEAGSDSKSAGLEHFKERCCRCSVTKILKDNQGETGMFIDMSMQPEAVL